MNQANPLNDNTLKSNSKMIWLGLQASTPFLAMVILVMDSVAQMEPIVPNIKNILIAISVLTIPAAFFLTTRFRNSENEIKNNIHAGVDNPPETLQTYIQFLVFGMSLVELPAILGIVLYITTGEVLFSMFFIFVSFALGFFYKPSL